MTLVDTNVLLDVATNDRGWAEWSVNRLDAAAIRGPLLINAVAYAEFSVGFVRVEEVDRVLEGPGADWPAPDALLLRAADELHVEQRISDATWEELSARYDTQQLIELPMLVGHYHLVAMTLNTLGVELEPGYEDLPR